MVHGNIQAAHVHLPRSDADRTADVACRFRNTANMPRASRGGNRQYSRTNTQQKTRTVAFSALSPPALRGWWLWRSLRRHGSFQLKQRRGFADSAPATINYSFLAHTIRTLPPCGGCHPAATQFQEPGSAGSSSSRSDYRHYLGCAAGAARRCADSRGQRLPQSAPNSFAQGHGLAQQAFLVTKHEAPQFRGV